jgi:hypothetical protein
MSRDAEARTSAMESRGGPFSPDVQTRRALRARDKLRPAGDESAARSAARGDRDLDEPSRAKVPLGVTAPAGHKRDEEPHRAGP